VLVAGGDRTAQAPLTAGASRPAASPYDDLQANKADAMRARTGLAPTTAPVAWRWLDLEANKARSMQAR
jgi:hypothetical protein